MKKILFLTCSLFLSCQIYSQNLKDTLCTIFELQDSNFLGYIKLPKYELDSDFSFVFKEITRYDDNKCEQFMENKGRLGYSFTFWKDWNNTDFISIQPLYIDQIDPFYTWVLEFNKVDFFCFGEIPKLAYKISDSIRLNYYLEDRDKIDKIHMFRGGDFNGRVYHLVFNGTDIIMIIKDCKAWEEFMVKKHKKRKWFVMW